MPLPYIAFILKHTMEKHQHNSKRILIAVLILLSVIFMIIGPRAKADAAEKARLSHIEKADTHIVTVIKSIVNL